MSLATGVQIPAHSLEESENWDDDFEFQEPNEQRNQGHQQRRRNRKPGAHSPTTTTDPRKMSIASSAALEDWDVEEGSSASPSSPFSPAISPGCVPPSSPPRASTSRATPLPQSVLSRHVEPQTENWDDDFEDPRNSPKKRATGSSKGKSSESSRAPRMRQQEESWDDELALEEEAAAAAAAVGASSDTEDDDGELGFAEKEEDRTVTAKSRRAALKRLSSEHPPLPGHPPVPPLPLTSPFLPHSHSSSPHTHNNPYPYQPFPPRSPTSSVFSVPTTAHTHGTHNSNSQFYSSTTHLRPSSAFALLPPSPPLHKERGERERRRLRKKSRPKPQGMFELSSLASGSRTSLAAYQNGSETRLGAPSSSSQAKAAWNRDRNQGTRYSFSSDGDAEPSASEAPQLHTHGALHDIRRLRTETPTTDVSSVDDHRPRAYTTSVVPSVPSTPTKAGALLSRIGSVKKWGVRRKRASTTPSEVVADELQDIHRTPRAQPSRTSFHHAPPPPMPVASSSKRNSISTSPPHPDVQTSTAPSSTSNWFFRASSAGSPHARAGGRSGGGKESNRSRGAEGGEAKHERGRSGSVSSGRSRRSARGRDRVVSSKPDLSSAPSTPNKLVKRKSLGFVQLKNAIVGGGGDNVAEGSPRKPRYIGIGLGRAESKGREQEADDRPRRDSNVSSGGVEDGSRGFMGSVRRISLVARHKRTKSGSGVLLSSVGEGSFGRSTMVNHKGKGALPYMLPPLPANGSQLSLRLPSSSSYSSGKRDSRHGSMHDLPSLFPPSAMRMVSNNSQTSQASSIMPASSVSGSSSRNVSGKAPQSQQQTPINLRRRASTRSGTSEERRKSVSSQRPSTDTPDFATKLSQAQPPVPSSATSKQSDGSLPKTPSKPPATLLPPIELQPPSPPRTVTKAADSKAKQSNILSSFDALTAATSIAALSPSASTSSVFFTPSSSPHRLSPNANKSPVSLQSASLGRSTAVASAVKDESSSSGNGSGSGGNGSGGPPRRNSLGDLKIPARISQAQVGLRRDLGMVKEFANNVEQLKELQQTYNNLVTEIQAVLESQATLHAAQQRQAEVHSQSLSPQPPSPAPRATSPSFFSKLRPKSRSRSNTTTTSPAQPQATSPTAAPSDPSVSNAQVAYKELASAFYTINSKYRVTWECADLLIELGSGSSAAADSTSGAGMTSAPPSTSQTPALPADGTFQQRGSLGPKRSRERAITLSGEQSSSTGLGSNSVGRSTGVALAAGQMPAASPPLASPPPSMSWRASTGRHDLSQRQLSLLKEMLNNSNAHADVHAGGDEDGTAGFVETREVSPSGILAHAMSSEEHNHLHSNANTLHANVNREWRWGDPRNSTITLPSEDGSGAAVGGRDKDKENRRRSGRLGMTGLRDMLRALKRSASEGGPTVIPTPPLSAVPSTPAPPPPPSIPIQSTTSLSTESSAASGSYRRRLQKQPPPGSHHTRQSSQHRSTHRTGKSSTGPETVNASQSIRSKQPPVEYPSQSLPSPTSFSPVAGAKPSPRRPSLASIFRIGKRPVSSMEDSGVVGAGASRSGLGVDDDGQTSGIGEGDLSSGDGSSSTGDEAATGGDEEDWDQMDSASDLDAAARALGMETVRMGSQKSGKGGRWRSSNSSKKGRSPYLQGGMFDPPSNTFETPPSASMSGLALGPSSASALAGRHTVISKRSFSASQSSFTPSTHQQGSSGSPLSPSTVASSRPTRLSNVEELVDADDDVQGRNREREEGARHSHRPLSQTQAQHPYSSIRSVSQTHPLGPSRPSSSKGHPSASAVSSTHTKSNKSGSVRSMPPQLVASATMPAISHGSSLFSSSGSAAAVLAMTPENIKPLLENAREVHARLCECVEEIRGLVAVVDI